MWHATKLKSVLPLLLSLVIRPTFASQAPAPEQGPKIELRSCTPCHSLRLIHSQRLSAAAWQKEIKKMIGWGAVVPNQQILVDYLAQEYSDAKPVPDPPLSAPAAK